MTTAMSIGRLHFGGDSSIEILEAVNNRVVVTKRSNCMTINHSLKRREGKTAGGAGGCAINAS